MNSDLSNESKAETLQIPLVSILIPLYNAEQFISETLESLLSQTYKNIEIIIVDDGSIDSSLKIANKYEELHSNISVYIQENSGAAAARNKAFTMSTGEYIQYFDADDIIHPDKIMSQIEALRAYNFKPDFVTTGKRGFFLNSIESAKFENQVIYKSYNDKFLFLKEAWENCECIVGPAWLISRELNNKVGNWNTHLTTNDDGEFFARVVYNSKKIIFVKESIIYYRKGNADSLSSNKSNSGARSHLDSLHVYANLVKNDMQMHSLHKALTTLYSTIYRDYFPLNKQLKDELYCNIFKLGYSKPLIHFNKRYIWIVNFFGLDTALYLRRFKIHIALLLGIRKY